MLFDLIARTTVRSVGVTPAEVESHEPEAAPQAGSRSLVLAEPSY